VEDVGVPAGDELLHARARRRRLWLLAAAAAVVVAFSGAGTRAPDEPANAGVTAVRPAYQGRYLTPGDVATLQAQGLATAEVLNRELACQGVELYFDTAAERDAYVADYAARFPVEPAYVDADPCRPYRDSPRYVAGQ
jgi:hypothetical protein